MNELRTSAKTWTPAVPRKIPDNLVSSDYTTAKTFVPSYEKEEERPRIGQLLAHDYQRIWWQEKLLWDRKLVSKARTKRILPRMLVKRKVPTCVTVKYLTKAERLKEKAKKEAPRKSNGNSNLEVTKCVEREDTKSESEKCESEKLKKCEETTSKTCEEVKSETYERARSENCGETKSENGEKTKSEDIKLEKCENTELKNYEETREVLESETKTSQMND